MNQSRKKRSRPSQPYNVISEITLDCAKETEMLRKCLSATREQTKGKCTITEEHIAEMAGELQEALDWAQTFYPEKTSSEVRKVEHWIESLETLIEEMKKDRPEFARLAIRSLMETKGWLEMKKTLLLSGRVLRHFRPNVGKIAKGSQPTISAYKESVKSAGERHSKSRFMGTKINDTKEKPFQNFFFTAHEIISKEAGKQIFLGLVYDEIYRPKIMKIHPTGKEPRDIFKNSVKEILRNKSQII